jgi:hypothetical protein
LTQKRRAGSQAAELTALLAIFGVALVMHALQGELPLTLFVYVAGVAFVMAHGSAVGRGVPLPDNHLQPTRHT